MPRQEDHEQTPGRHRLPDMPPSQYLRWDMSDDPLRYWAASFIWKARLVQLGLDPQQGRSLIGHEYRPPA